LEIATGVHWREVATHAQSLPTKLITHRASRDIRAATLEHSGLRDLDARHPGILGWIARVAGRCALLIDESQKRPYSAPKEPLLLKTLASALR